MFKKEPYGNDMYGELTRKKGE